ncbi:unnamed protein product [Laminaria digitata]
MATCMVFVHSLETKPQCLARQCDQNHSWLTRFIYRQRKHWARCYHPTAMTLGMAASSRMEGIFGVLKHATSSTGNPP